MPGRKRTRQCLRRFYLCFYVSLNMSLHKLWEIVKDREAWHAAVRGSATRVGHDLANEPQDRVLGFPTLAAQQRRCSKLCLR